MKITHLLRPLTLLATLIALVAGVPAAALAASSAPSGTGFVRLAHLSPNTPAVDVYLYSFGNSSAVQVLNHVSYGDVSPYLRVPAGEYTVAMRAAGAAATSKPVISQVIDVTANQAYTVAGVGKKAGLQLRVLHDSLSPPPGKTLMRIIQASLTQRTVAVSWNGKQLERSLAFSSVSPYLAVSPMTSSLTVTGKSEHVRITIPLTAGTVHTLVVLDGAKGLVIDDLLDAAGSSAMPAGGAATGFGGMAPRAPSSPLPWLAGIGAGLVLATAGGFRLLRRRIA